MCLFPEVPLRSGTVTSSVSLWVAAPTRRDISSFTGKQARNRGGAIMALSCNCFKMLQCLKSHPPTGFKGTLENSHFKPEAKEFQYCQRNRLFIVT